MTSGQNYQVLHSREQELAADDTLVTGMVHSALRVQGAVQRSKLSGAPRPPLPSRRGRDWGCS